LLLLYIVGDFFQDYLLGCSLCSFLGYSFCTLKFENLYMGSIPWSERSSGEGNGNHSSILAWKFHDTGGWWAIVHGFAKSQRCWVTKHKIQVAFFKDVCVCMGEWCMYNLCVKGYVVAILRKGPRLVGPTSCLEKRVKLAFYWVDQKFKCSLISSLRE